MTELDYDALYVEWAKDRYGIGNAVSVAFSFEEGSPDYGCETCGYGAEPPHIEVWIRCADGTHEYREENYAPELINSLMKVARNA